MTVPAMRSGLQKKDRLWVIMTSCALFVWSVQVTAQTKAEAKAKTEAKEGSVHAATSEAGEGKKSDEKVPASEAEVVEEGAADGEKPAVEDGGETDKSVENANASDDRPDKSAQDVKSVAPDTEVTESKDDAEERESATVAVSNDDVSSAGVDENEDGDLVKGHAPNDTAMSVWIAGSISAASIVLGTVFGFVAIDKENSFNESPSASLADEGETFSIIADAFFGLALVGVVAGGDLVFRGRLSSRRWRRRFFILAGAYCG